MTLRDGFSLGGYLPALLGDSGGVKTSFLGKTPRHDDEAMEWALCAAMETVGLSSPNPNVGCIIVRDHKVVAQGATQKFGGIHGERAAILQAPHPESLRGATAYIMLEPCAHHGKQPPCTEALIQAGIHTCVIGSQDPHPLVQGRGLKHLREAGIKIQKSTLASECIAFNLPFFIQCAFQRPFIVAKWAQTLNGFLADDGQGSQWISGPKARKVTHYLRSKYDAILVGAGTVLADTPSLTARLFDSEPNRHPLKIIFDPSSRLFQCQDHTTINKILSKTLSSVSKTVIVCDEKVPLPSWVKGHEAYIYFVRVSNKNAAFSYFLNHLNSPEFLQWYGQPIQSVLVEGGASMINYLISIDAIDAFQIFINPSFLAGTKHLIHPLSHGENTPASTPKSTSAFVSSMQRYHLLQSSLIGQDSLVEMMPEDRYQKVFAGLQTQF